MSQRSLKQNQFWDFLREHSDKNGKFPKFKEIAEKFGISTAAVSHRIDTMIQQKRLVKLPFVGYVLLNKDGSIHYPDRENFYINSHLELCIPLPQERIPPSDNILIFKLLRDFNEQFSLRYDDIIEIKKVSTKKLKSGDLIVAKKGNIFTLNIYMFPLILSERNGALPEYIYNKYDPDNRILGIVSGVYRTAVYGLL